MEENNALNLRCEVDANPKADTIQWRKQEQIIAHQWNHTIPKLGKEVSSFYFPCDIIIWNFHAFLGLCCRCFES